MDLNVIDIAILENNCQKLNNALQEFSSFYRDFKSSYINTCEDSSISSIAKKLNEKYKKIENGYKNIISWCNEYLNEVNGVEKKIAQLKGSPISDGDILSFSSKLSALEKCDTSLADLLDPSLIKEVNPIKLKTLEFSEPKSSFGIFGSFGMSEKNDSKTDFKNVPFTSDYNEFSYNRSGGIFGSFNSKISDSGFSNISSTSKKFDSANLKRSFGETAAMNAFGPVGLGAVALLNILGDKKEPEIKFNENSTSKGKFSFNNNHNSLGNSAYSSSTGSMSGNKLSSDSTISSNSSGNSSFNLKGSAIGDKNFDGSSSLSSNMSSFNVMDVISNLDNSTYFKTSAKLSDSNITSNALALSNVKAVEKASEVEIENKYRGTGIQRLLKSGLELNSEMIGGPVGTIFKGASSFFIPDVDTYQNQVMDKVDDKTSDIRSNVWSKFLNKTGSTLEAGDSAVSSFSSNLFNGLRDKTNNEYAKSGVTLVEKFSNMLIDNEKSKATSKFNVAASAYKGVFDFGEGVNDANTIRKGFMETPFTLLEDFGRAVQGKEAINFFSTNKLWNNVKEKVAVREVDESFDNFYSSKLGQFVDNNASIKSDSAACKVVTGVTKTLSIIATSLFGGAIIGGAGSTAGVASSALEVGAVTGSNLSVFSSALAGVGGLGQGAEDAWNDDASVSEGLGYGILNGGWEGLQFYIGSRINLFGKGTGEATNSIVNAWGKGVGSAGKDTAIRIFMDGVDGSLEGFVQPLMKKVYKDESYKDLFTENGGWGYVLTNGIIGAGVSFLTETPEIRRILTSSKTVSTDDGFHIFSNTNESLTSSKISKDFECVISNEDIMDQLPKKSGFSDFISMLRKLGSSDVSMSEKIDSANSLIFGGKKDLIEEGINSKEIVSQIDDNKLSALFEYNKILSLDNRLKDLVESDGAVYVPKELAESFEKLRILKSQIGDIKEVPKFNLEEAVKNFKVPETLEKASERLNKLMVSEELEQLVKDAKDDKTVNIPDYLLKDFTEANLLKSQIERLSNSNNLVKKEVASNASKVNIFNSMFERIKNGFGASSSKVSDGFESSIKHPLKETLSGSPKKSLFSDFVSILRKLGNSDVSLSKKNDLIEEGINNKEVVSQIDKVKEVPKFNLEEAVKNFKVPETLEEASERLNKLMVSEELEKLVKDANDGKLVSIPSSLLYSFTEANLLKSHMDILSENSLGKNEVIDTVSNTSSKMNIFSSLFEKMNKGLEATTSKVSDGFNSKVTIRGIPDDIKPTKIIKPDVIDNVVRNRPSLEEVLAGYNKPKTLQEAIEYCRRILNSDSRLVSIMDNFKKGNTVDVPDELYSRYVTLSLLYDQISKAENALKKAQVSSTPMPKKLVQQLTKEYNTILSSDSRLQRFVYMLRDGDDFIVPLDLQNKFNQLVAIAREIETINPKGNIGTSIVMNPKETIVISDLHGNLDRFETVKQKMTVNPNAKIIVLGDAMDRGAHGVEILLQIKELCDQGRMKYVPGNHDMFAYNYLRSPKKSSEFSSAQYMLKMNGGVSTMNDLNNFDSVVNTLYSNGTLSKKVTLKEFTNWLGSQPIQCITEENNTKYAIAHAVFDSKLYKYKSSFNLEDGYKVSIDPKQKNLFNQFLNIMEYRFYDSNYSHAPLSLPKGYDLIVGHSSQTEVNVHSISDELKAFAVYVDTGKAPSLRGYNLSNGKEVDFLKVLQDFNTKLDYAKSVNARIATNASSILDNSIKQKKVENLPVEILKMDQETFLSGLRKLDESVMPRSDLKTYELFKKTMKNNYGISNDKNVNKILSNIYKLNTLNFEKSKIGTSYYSDAYKSIVIKPDYVTNENERIINHEFGHALHFIVTKDAIPDNYENVISEVKRNINTKTGADLQKFINLKNNQYNNALNYVKSSMGSEVERRLKQYQTFMSKDELESFCKKYNIKVDVNSPIMPKIVENVRRTLIQNDLAQGIVDKKREYALSSLDIISNIYQKNKFSVENVGTLNVLLGHAEDYYVSSKASFREMIANYFELKVSGKEKEVRNLRYLFGNEWYNMMESFMGELARKIEVM